jgi:hypothetical protein
MAATKLQDETTLARTRFFGAGPTSEPNAFYKVRHAKRRYLAQN